MRNAATVLIAPPQPGDIVCVPVPGDVGKLIELGQWLAGQKFKPYEHAMIYTGEADADGPYGYTYSAYTDGQCKKPLPGPPEQLPGSLWSSGILPLSDVQREQVTDWCHRHADIGYSGADYVALAAARLHLDALLPPIRHYIQETGHLICSQYTTLARLAAGDNLFNRAWDGLVMPMDLAELILHKLTELRDGGVA